MSFGIPQLSHDKVTGLPAVKLQDNGLRLGPDVEEASEEVPVNQRISGGGGHECDIIVRLLSKVVHTNRPVIWYILAREGIASYTEHKVEKEGILTISSCRILRLLREDTTEKLLLNWDNNVIVHKRIGVRAKSRAQVRDGVCRDKSLWLITMTRTLSRIPLSV